MMLDTRDRDGLFASGAGWFAWPDYPGESVRENSSFAPLGLSIFHSDPRLTPWASFSRRSAAQKRLLHSTVTRNSEFSRTQQSPFDCARAGGSQAPQPGSLQCSTWNILYLRRCMYTDMHIAEE